MRKTGNQIINKIIIVTKISSMYPPILSRDSFAVFHKCDRYNSFGFGAGGRHKQKKKQAETRNVEKA